jgi:hypothetical protein
MSDARVPDLNWHKNPDLILGAEIYALANNVRLGLLTKMELAVEVRKLISETSEFKLVIQQLRESGIPVPLGLGGEQIALSLEIRKVGDQLQINYLRLDDGQELNFAENGGDVVAKATIHLPYSVLNDVPQVDVLGVKP